MTLKSNGCEAIVLYCDILTCSNSSLFLPAAFSLSAFPFFSPIINLSTIVYIQLYCRSGRTSPVPSLIGKGDVRAMALQVSALNRSLSVSTSALPLPKHVAHRCALFVFRYRFV